MLVTHALPNFLINLFVVLSYYYNQHKPWKLQSWFMLPINEHDELAFVSLQQKHTWWNY
jgi:hypothetical protein